MNDCKEPDYLGSAIQYIDSWLQTQIFLDNKNPGYSIAISCHGKIVYSRGFGYANVDNKEEMTPDHIFRIASHSKSFTATAVMNLVAAGKLSLDDKICQYLPFINENPDQRYQTITVQNLLEHSAGISRDGPDATFFDLMRDFPDKQEIISYFKTAPLIIDPNTRFKYSNFGFALLPWIIEVVTGRPYADYIYNDLLDPLGLTDIRVEYDDSIKPYTTGYSPMAPNGDQAPISITVNTKDLYGIAGYCSTASNLCLFYDAVMPGSGKLFSDDLKHEMLRQHWHVPDMPVKQGYGLGYIAQDYCGRQLNGHIGGMPGNVSHTLFDSNDGIVVAILSNGHRWNITDMQEGVWHILDKFKAEYDPASPYLNITGQFYGLWSTINLVPLGQKIYVTDPENIAVFDLCPEAVHIKDNLFRMTRDHGFDYFYEDMRLNMDGDIVSKVRLAGYDYYNQDDFQYYIKDLKDKYNQK